MPLGMLLGPWVQLGTEGLWSTMSNGSRPPQGMRPRGAAARGVQAAGSQGLSKDLLLL